VILRVDRVGGRARVIIDEERELLSIDAKFGFASFANRLVKLEYCIHYKTALRLYISA